MKLVHWVSIAIGAAILIAGGVIVWKQNQKHQPSLVEESEEERDAAIQQAFSPSVTSDRTTDVSTDPELLKIANNFFKDLGIAFARQDQDKIQTLVSGEAMFNLVDRAGLVDIKGAKQRKQFRESFKRGFAQGLSNFSQLMSFDDFDVLRLEEIDTAKAVLAFLKEDDPESELIEFYEEEFKSLEAEPAPAAE